MYQLKFDKKDLSLVWYGKACVQMYKLTSRYSTVQASELPPVESLCFFPDMCSCIFIMKL